MQSKVRKFTVFFSAFHFRITQGLLKEQNLKNDYIKSYINIIYILYIYSWHKVVRIE